MGDWARREMELKCERSNFKELNDACIAAFDAYVSLNKNVTKQKHIKYAKIMLDRLLEKKPLTPISEEDEWNYIGARKDEDTEKEYDFYVCDRYPSLRKQEFKDGTVKYSDIDRVVGIDVGNPENEFNCMVLTNLVDEVLPIHLPYYPLMEKHKVYCETISLLDYPTVSRKFDFLGVKAVVEPGIEGSYTEIDRCFYFPSDFEVIEISKEDYSNACYNSTMKK